MKGYYIHFGGRASAGVSRKIDMQLLEFGRYYDVQELEATAERRTIIQRVIGLLPFAENAWNYKELSERIDAPDFLYIRRTVADKAQIRFLQRIREKYPTCKILLEIFTYPYDKDEFLRMNAWPFWIKDKWYRRSWKKYIDRVVTYSEDNSIFGIRTIQIRNGIIVEDIIPRKIKSPVSDTIDLLAVAYMQKQHGYERIIKGLNVYYSQGGKRKIVLHMVGNGPELPRYQKMVRTMRLGDKVIFYGLKTGRELDEMYDRCAIALGAFGGYKNRLYLSSALKVREYLAKGLPVISGMREDVISEEKSPYFLEFDNNSSVIDVNRIINFYDRIYAERSPETVTKEIRSYAYSHAGMDISLREVIDFIGGK